MEHSAQRWRSPPLSRNHHPTRNSAARLSSLPSRARILVIYCRNVSLRFDAKLFWRPFLSTWCHFASRRKGRPQIPTNASGGPSKKKTNFLENSGDLPLTLDLQSNAATCRGERDVVFRNRTAAYSDRWSPIIIISLLQRTKKEIQIASRTGRALPAAAEGAPQLFEERTRARSRCWLLSSAESTGQGSLRASTWSRPPKPQSR